ncbi:MAG: hypothetical protein ACOVVK_05530 [Elsteraceae bacterium]
MTYAKRSSASRLGRLAIGGLAAGVAVAILILGAATLFLDRVVPPTPPKAVAPLTAEPAAIGGFQISGFRTARFGMKEDELREALAKDFGLSPASLSVTEAAGLGARTLSFLLDGLVPGAGVAQISYIIGYQGKDLIPISAPWGGPGRPETGAPQVEAAAAELKRYFRSMPLDPASIAFDLAQADGSMVLARARDPKGHVAMLIRTDLPDNAGVRRPMVQLVYIRDDKQPDIFRIQKGQF